MLKIKFLQFDTVVKAVHLHYHVPEEIDLYYVFEVFECCSTYESQVVFLQKDVDQIGAVLTQ